MRRSIKGNDCLIFTKMLGPGNSVMIIDNSAGCTGAQWSSYAAAWCDQTSTSGADGLLVIEPSYEADFSLRMFDSDGHEAGPCHIGIQCAAQFAYDRRIAAGTMTIETPGGILSACVDDTTASCKLTDPMMFRGGFSLDIGGSECFLYSVNAGTPHAVLFKDHVAEMTPDYLHTAGCSISSHPAFDPEGTNVNFVEVIGPGVIRVRTYEQDVEAETQACCTGAAVAAAISHACKGIDTSPIAVQMPGGILFVDFKTSGTDLKDVWVGGAVRSVYNGELTPGLIPAL